MSDRVLLLNDPRRRGREERAVERRASCPHPHELPATRNEAWRSRGYLPHFDQPGTVQFLTFRLADAVPADTVAAWKSELNMTGHYCPVRS